MREVKKEIADMCDDLRAENKQLMVKIQSLQRDYDRIYNELIETRRKVPLVE